MTPAYTLSPDGKSITCTKCGKTSYNLHDVKHRYCGFCHEWLKTELPASKCPVCGYTVDDASSVSEVYDTEDDRKFPVPGDLSLCLKCGEVLVFDQTMHMAQAGIDDFEGVSPLDLKAIELLQAKIRAERPIK